MNYVQEFEKRLARNKSQNTINTYTRVVKQMLEVVPVEKLDEDSVIDYFVGLKDKYSPKTLWLYANAVYSFLQFLNKKMILSNPFDSAGEITEYLPAKQDKDVIAFTRKQLEKLFKEYKNEPLKIALFRFMYDTGTRVSEVATARKEHITIGERITLDVWGKGKGGMSKKRTVVISKETHEELKRYWSTTSESEFIFSHDGLQYTTRGLSKIVEKVADEMNYDFMSCHTFRKTIATHLLERGMKIEYVAAYLGHNGTQTLFKHYADLNNDLHNNFDKFYKSL